MLKKRDLESTSSCESAMMAAVFAMGRCCGEGGIVHAVCRQPPHKSRRTQEQQQQQSAWGGITKSGEPAQHMSERSSSRAALTSLERRWSKCKYSSGGVVCALELLDMTSCDRSAPSTKHNQTREIWTGHFMTRFNLIQRRLAHTLPHHHHRHRHHHQNHQQQQLKRASLCPSPQGQGSS